MRKPKRDHNIDFTEKREKIKFFLILAVQLVVGLGVALLAYAAGYGGKSYHSRFVRDIFGALRRSIRYRF
jgi:hypothetical protein